MGKTRVCIGFGEHRGRCGRVPREGSRFWCERCDALRIQHVDAALRRIADQFGAAMLDGKKREGGDA